MATIFHLTTAAEWEAAQPAAVYTGSTRGRTLAEEGFIHCSRGDQWPGVRDRFYADVEEPLVLLKIDTDRLDVPVVEEPGEPGQRGGNETFPHLYGPLPVAAVSQAIPLAPSEPSTASQSPAPTSSGGTASDGTPSGTSAPAPAAAPASDEFSTIFFREMFRNVVVLVVLCAAVMGGSFLGHAIRDDGWGAIAGLVVGAVVGVPLALRVRKWISADE